MDNFDCYRYPLLLLQQHGRKLSWRLLLMKN